MIDFSDHGEVMKARAAAQEIEHDRREKMRECIDFVTKDDGQWEDNILKKFDDNHRPRYTFDMTGTLVNKYYGEMTQNDFNIRVTPMGGGASKDTAKLNAGLIKNTESLSRATNVYCMAARLQIICGFDCVRVDQDYASPDSFDQDLFIRHIPDSVSRVWFLGNYQERTCEDADGVIVEHLVSCDEYEEMFGRDKDDAAQSLGDSICRTSYYYRRHGIRIGELIYKKKVSATLYQLDDGTVLDEEGVKAAGLSVKGLKSKKRETHEICSRWFDAQGWLKDSEDTVFKFLPIVPILPNFMIVQDKPISRGIVEPLMDWQRVRNYTGSAFVEETALAPKDIIMMTREQIAGNQKDIGKLNIAGRPILPYTHVDGQQPPFKPGVYSPNSGLVSMFTMTEQGIQSSAGMFAAGLGDNPALQSGVAIERLDNNSNLGMMECFKAQEVALGQIGKILVTAYPSVYDTEQERRIVNDDGSDDLVKVNEVGLNGEVFNDLSKGIYDVYCDIGKAFRSRQQETAESIVQLGGIDPSFVAQNKDILLSSLDSPGMDMAAERARAELMKAGVIPESQWTDEEREQIAAAQAAAANTPPQPDPAMIIAQAELEKAQAKTIEQELKAIQLQQNQQKMDFEQQLSKLDKLMEQRKNEVDEQVKMASLLNTMADTLQKIGSSMGVDAIISPNAAQAYDEQAQNIEELQQQM